MPPSSDMQSFQEHLRKSRRILALVGAGLSASSGLPTFRGAGGLWRSFDAKELATPESFERNPGLVWQFYNYRRHMSLQAEPNKAHYALAELARKNKDFITISQNVDGLSPRAQHPTGQLHLLHGSLFDIKCSECDYVRKDDYTDPVVPALEIPKKGISFPAVKGKDKGAPSLKTTKLKPSQEDSEKEKELDISNAQVPIPEVAPSDLPHCPQCDGLLRPGVVWFGEPLPEDTLSSVDEWIKKDDIDLMLVIGTSSTVQPAASYTWTARDAGARIAVINMDENDAVGRNFNGLRAKRKKGTREERKSGRARTKLQPPSAKLGSRDWFFKGDAAVIVPEILKSVIGEI